MSDPFIGFTGHALGAVLIDADIRRLVAEGDLISDFEEGSLQEASYDLRLGSESFTRGDTTMLSAENPRHAKSGTTAQWIAVAIAIVAAAIAVAAILVAEV